MRIFLIDDDQLFNLNFNRQLTKEDQYEIHSFDSLADAIDEIDLKPDIIVLDHHLRGTKGLEIIPYFRERLPNTEIIYISGQSSIEVLAKAHQIGASHYLKKDEQLIENIVKLIKEKTGHQKNRSSSFSFIKQIKKIKSTIKKKSIFIVDDDELYSVFLKYKLSRKGNYNISIFLDEQELLKETSKEPDILVLDYHLIKIPAEVIIDTIKKESPTTKIIMLSSQTNIDVALDLFEIGIDDYVVKNKNWEDNLLYCLQKHSISAEDLFSE